MKSNLESRSNEPRDMSELMTMLKEVLGLKPSAHQAEEDAKRSKALQATSGWLHANCPNHALHAELADLIVRLTPGVIAVVNKTYDELGEHPQSATRIYVAIDALQFMLTAFQEGLIKARSVGSDS